MKDQFVAGSTSKALRVKLIGNGHRHRDSQVKQALREVVEAAKHFEASHLHQPVNENCPRKPGTSKLCGQTESEKGNCQTIRSSMLLV